MSDEEYKPRQKLVLDAETKVALSNVTECRINVLSLRDKIGSVTSV